MTVITAPRKMWTFKDVPKASAATCEVAVAPLRILKNSKRKRKIYKTMCKNTARLPENLCSTIIILKSDVTSNGAKC